MFLKETLLIAFKKTRFQSICELYHNHITCTLLNCKNCFRIQLEGLDFRLDPLGFEALSLLQLSRALLPGYTGASGPADPKVRDMARLVLNFIVFQ